jgi:hypothetical protein
MNSAFSCAPFQGVKKVPSPCHLLTRRAAALDLGPQFAEFLQKYPLANARELARHFLTNAPTMKEILQSEL